MQTPTDERDKKFHEQSAFKLIEAVKTLKVSRKTELESPRYDGFSKTITFNAKCIYTII